MSFSNLWIFVSNFTEQNAKQLYKIYRQAIKDIELIPRPTPEVKRDDKMERKSILDVIIFLIPLFYYY